MQTVIRTALFSLLVFAGVTAAVAQSAFVVTLGDSLTQGDGDDGSGGGYPARLQALLQTPYPGSTVSNLGISGDTTTDLINKQLENAVNQLQGAPAGFLKIALVWIGSNDLFGLYNSTVCTEYYPDLATCESTEIGNAITNVNTILTRLRATGAALYVALLDDQSRRPVMTDPILRAEQMPGISESEVSRMATQIVTYNTGVQSAAAAHGATTVDFYSTTLFESRTTLSDDGNHPNGAGYDAIVQIWNTAITGSAPPVGGDYTLSVQLSGSGTVSATGIDCGSNCSESYASGTTVTLTAIPATGYSFSGWGGACSGTGTCVLTMDRNRTATATFAVTTSSTGTLENPQPNTAASGIGLLSGWICDATRLEFEFLNEQPFATRRIEAAYGSYRGDTESVCGDTDNGFGLTINFNRLGDGNHTVIGYADGVEFARTTFSVTTLGSEFLSGLAGRFTLAGFPRADSSVQLQWQESSQNFVITGRGAATSALSGAVAPLAAHSALENPQPSAFASGIGLLSGWHCNATGVEFEFLDEQPFATRRIEAAYGSYRGDTASVCGDTDNGFGLTINFNKLGDGNHTVIGYADGVEFARATFSVTTLGSEFLSGTAGSHTLDGFPATGGSVTLTWQEAAQNFIITGYSGGSGGNGGGSTSLLQASDFQYLGAFRLPGEEMRPRTFEYGGNAMTFNPSGDPGGAVDGYPGSLFVSGHDRIAYGGLPDGGQIAELVIPVPVIASDVSALPSAAFLQTFQNVFQGWFTQLEEIPRMAMQHLDQSAAGAKIHAAWGAHFQSDGGDPSHVWFDSTLSNPQMQGPWYIGEQDPYRTSGYMLEIPRVWADRHVGGMYLGTGRYRDGGWSGQGPNIFAYQPWTASGAPAAANARLPVTTLLTYADSFETDDVTYHAMDDYQHPDEWEGGAWITTTSGKSALLFAGTKAMGDRYWYGWVNPLGAQHPCPQAGYEGAACLRADGTNCPASEQNECAGHNEMRGWWASEFSAWFILYDPDDLAGVAAGAMQSWEPQPYARLDIDGHLFMNPDRVETEMLGTGVQRRMRIGEVTFDRAHDLLYVLELFVDGAKPVVHVWRVN